MRKVLFNLIKLIKKVLSLLKLGFLGKNRLISSFRSFLYKLSKPEGIVLIKVQGLPMYLDSTDTGVAPLLLLDGIYEKDETLLFKELVKNADVVLDIGSNFGYYSLLASEQINSSGKIYAFEPDPSNYELLCKNLHINNIKSIIPVKKAISNVNGKSRLFIEKANLGGHSLAEQNISDQKKTIEVSTITLDEFFYNHIEHPQVDFIKMDVQGAEGLVLSGGKKLLKNNKLKIMMEFWPYGLKNFGLDPTSFLEEIKSFGFSFKLIKKQLSDIDIASLNQFIQTSKHEKSSFNLLLEN